MTTVKSACNFSTSSSSWGFISISFYLNTFLALPRLRFYFFCIKLVTYFKEIMKFRVIYIKSLIKLRDFQLPLKSFKVISKK